MLNWISIIAWAAIAQGFFLSILYLSSRQHRSASNRVLAFFLLSLLVEAISMFLSVDAIAGYDLMHYFAFPETLLFFPALFLLYVLLKIGRASVYMPWIRLVLGLGFAIWGLTLFNLLLFFVNGKSITAYLAKEQITAVYYFQEYLACVLAWVAIVIAIRELRVYTRKIKAEYSDYSLLDINWLWQFTLSIVPVALLWGAELVRIALGGIGTSDIATATWGVLFVYIYYVSYKAFVQKDLFEASPKEQEELLSGSNPNLTSNPEDEQEMTALLDRLESQMNQEKLFLQSDLTLHELARLSSFPARKISQSINRKYDTNFSEWVNRYRVEEAKNRLANFSDGHLTIEGIGHEAGFKSRSAMYLAFKKITGKSPGDFKN